ncbi:FliO/MopB family protein [Thermosyntropha lipolytica]|uniref:FliO/MopB family protein n=1 Tax=Thermosyntropha lipolytica TaxID=54294 RepID=UPI001FA89578|nr:flagellar biosynthetic protein FliO [Thermosyntropha lipolytica]
MLILLLVLTAQAGAADMEKLNQELDKQNQVSVKGPSLWVSFLKLIIALGLIIGAAWSVLYIFNRQMNVKTQGTWINVVDQVVLGQNRGIVLCEIGEKLYALGVTDHSINLLFEVDNPKIWEEVSQTAYGLSSNNSVDDIYTQIKKGINNLLAKRRTPKIPERNFSRLMGEQIKKMQELSQNYGQDDLRDIYKRSDNHE